MIFSVRTVLVNFLGFTDEQASVIADIGALFVEAVAAVLIVFQLEQDKNIEKTENDIQEAQFILQYNQTFIQDENMSYVESCMERQMENGSTEIIINDENRQKFINYLVYLEGLAPLILSGVLKLDHIDDLFAYRFFLAVNNKNVQTDQLLRYAPYYQGCYKLYEFWSDYRKKNCKPIILEATSLDKIDFYNLYSGKIIVRKPQNKKEIKEAAGILYFTDKYIYPAAFKSKYVAKHLFPQLMRIEDGVFSKENIRIAIIDNKIVGAIIFFDSNVRADIDYSNVCNGLVGKGYDDVCKKYFNKLPGYIQSPNSIYISCVSVDKSYQNRGIGKILLKKLFDEYENKSFYLHVIDNNVGAIRLYEKMGFSVKKSNLNGYAYNEIPPKCLLMEKKCETIKDDTYKCEFAFN